METAFSRLVGCRLPIQLAVMGGGVGTPELAAAVTAAGGLGMVSAAYFAPLADQLDAVGGPVGVGFFAFDLPNRAADLELAASRARVVEVFWGDPDVGVVTRIHEGGALAFWQVGSVEEAKAAAEVGCDVVVAQGIEAGGHVRGTTPLLDLVSAVAPAIEVPLVAAGGVATGKAMRRCFDAGAVGVRIGTRLVATAESGAHPDYVAALIAAGGADTIYTTAFGADWPDAPHRVLRIAVERAEALGDEARWSAAPPTTRATGDVTAMAMYAGVGVGDVHDAPPVSVVIDRLMQELTTA